MKRWRTLSGIHRRVLAAILVVLSAGAVVGVAIAGPETVGNANATLSITPNDGSNLPRPSQITVTGAGFGATRSGDIIQCSFQVGLGLDLCSDPLARFASNASGNFSVSLQVTPVMSARNAENQLQSVNCAAARCTIQAVVDGGGILSGHHLTFYGQGDYDRSGTTDIAVFRSSNGVWFVRDGVTASWGTSGDRPVPGDYDGNGTTDIAVFRPAGGLWFVRDGVTASWGTSSDIPVPGDYDGNGTTDIAVFRPSSGVWFVRDGATASFGTSGDIPVPGDYNGNGTTDMAVFRPPSGIWFVRHGITAGFGTSGDIPVPGDYDGNGTTDLAVFRPPSGMWFVRNGITAVFGTSGDQPLPLPDAIQRSFA